MKVSNFQDNLRRFMGQLGIEYLNDLLVKINWSYAQLVKLNWGYMSKQSDF